MNILEANRYCILECVKFTWTAKKEKLLKLQIKSAKNKIPVVSALIHLNKFDKMKQLLYSTIQFGG